MKFYRIFNFIKDINIFDTIKIRNLERGVEYKSYWFDPRTGNKTNILVIKADKIGEYSFSGKDNGKPDMLDWVLVLEAKS